MLYKARSTSFYIHYILTSPHNRTTSKLVVVSSLSQFMSITPSSTVCLLNKPSRCSHLNCLLSFDHSSYSLWSALVSHSTHTSTSLSASESSYHLPHIHQRLHSYRLTSSYYHSHSDIHPHYVALSGLHYHLKLQAMYHILYISSSFATKTSLKVFVK